MEIIFWGTRGAISAPKPDQIIFGVHTTCIEIKNQTDSLLFDAGFGIGRYSDFVQQRPGTYHLFFTHFHWDHVQGIGYFIPIFLPATHMHLYSPWPIERLKRQLNYYFDYSFGPFESIEVLSSHMYYHPLQNTVYLNDFIINYFPNKHEGSCYGYSIESHGQKVALLTDHEASLQDSHTLWGTDYDVVIHDGQYSDEEYKNSSSGLGHSCFSQAVSNSRKLGARKILLTHHAPLRTDQELLAFEITLRRQHPDLDIRFAREQVSYPV
ncbi:hypothetical protein CSB45_06075 [candidate division KSB3 bacterium]|uniref:Metallo-beta-lactamase domain-containing protein n=1 Tax=candidate division KSB3 bacterium TaxID=2044937 RepID=A0A2G6E6R8_9BACT|nr:MAG: hypothetical protein CSB45_06075 [candidate division KSB3 bacterium]PIE30215.1 MAG: hypothetical protein CSA57_04790 [candidate division KSB3 bacterium]